MKRPTISAAIGGLLLFASGTHAAEPLDYTVKLETVMKHDDGKFLWFHPRAAAIPSGVVMTIQKHLKVSDYYSGLHFMRREGVDGAWSGPVLPPEIDWQPQADGMTLSVADVTPGWHEKTGRLIAIGCRVRYSPQGKQLDDVKRAHQTVYAIFDPKTTQWTPWQVLELPAGEEFNFARNACSQWVVKSDGKLLVPLYIGKSAKDRYSTTVAECRFDGAKLVYERNGDALRLDVARGLYEPSLIAFGARYFLTLRNDERGYVSVSDDGLHFAKPKPWTFDDGAELGSYNTQQHWLAHRDDLFLVYTRRGANNDHIVRHRAPLFMARVDPEELHIIRATEKIIVPERGAELGNFGCARISENESWVTVSEGMFMKDSAKRGAEGATFVARILWSKPNDEQEVSAPVITLPVRIHLVQSDAMPAMHTTLVETDVKRIMGKVNKIWSQAGIQFEIESIGPTTALPLPPEMRLKSEFDRVHAMIPKDRLSSKAIDVCYVKEVQPNGFFYGEPIVVKDTAKLREVPGGLDEPLPRVTSHEIGHALGLKHRQDTTNLMQSGTTGFSLNEAEIAIARKKAQEYLNR